MVKLMCMFRLADGVSEMELEEFYMNVHAEEVKTLQYVKRYQIGRVIEGENEKTDYYMVNSLYYDTLEEAKESISTPFAVEGRNKLLELTKDFTCMFIEEEDVI